MSLFVLNLTSNNSIFHYNFPRDFLDKSFEIGLIKIDGNLDIQNITSHNNKFIYRKKEKDINNNPIEQEINLKISEGKYDFEELLSEINHRLPLEDRNFFSIKLNKENKIILTINKDYKIDFTQTPISNVLGFENKIYDVGIHNANKEFNLSIIDNIFLKCNLIEDTYFNQQRLDSIYRFKSKEEINEVQNPIIYHKVESRPNKIILNLVDINNNLINFSDINLFVEVHLKEI